MSNYSMPVQIRWSDLDPNFHLRHSVYYDWAAMCRITYLQENGLTPALMQKMNFGPIIFREEAVFRKEVNYNDLVSVNLQLINARRDYTRWTIRHDIIRNNEILCATITIDGAWLNMIDRKLIIPPSEEAQVIELMSINENFQWTN